LLSHIARAQSLLHTLPSINISTAEQQRRLEQLTQIRDQKRALARRYRLLPEDGADSGSEERKEEEQKSEASTVKPEPIVVMKDE
jgi:hypothetical protein